MYIKSYEIFKKLENSEYIYPPYSPKNFTEWTKKGYIFTEKFLPTIEKECKKYLNILIKLRDSLPSKKLNRNELLYRGYRQRYNDDKLVRKKVRKDRRPLHTKEHIHKFMGDLFIDKFNWNPRTQGAFATSDIHKANLFGSKYLFFPIGNFDFLYHEKITDLTNYLYGKLITELGNNSYKKELNDRSKEVISEIVNNYTDKNLSKGIKKGSEVSFNCDEYLLMSERFIDFFLQYINTRESINTISNT